jgi:hypothetical protein
MEHRIYSNVEYNEEGGDLLGTELELTVDNGRVNGRLKIYEGGCAAPVQLTGSLSGNKLRASGQSDTYGRVEIAGALQEAAFDGFLRLEKAQAPEKMQLKKIAEPHC